MKISKNTILTVSTGLMFAMMHGCGGGGGTTKVTLAELTPEVAENMVISATEALPGCSYSSDTMLVKSSRYLDVINKSALKEIIEANKDTIPVLVGYSINNTTSGTCPTAPGSVTISGTHENGVDDLNYIYNNYCLGDDIESLTLNGTAAVKNVGVPSDSGPISQYKAISTGTDGITVIEKDTEGTYTHTVQTSDLKYTYGNGNDATTAESPSIMTIGSISILDGKTNETLDVLNVDISTYDSGANNIVIIDNITYTDPKNGSVNISSNAMTVSQDDIILAGEITVTGSDDTKVTMPLSTSVENAFDLIMNGETLGVMDCSGLGVSLL